MTDNVIKFPKESIRAVVQPEPAEQKGDPSVIEMLEHHLELAKKGEIIFAAIASVEAGFVGTSAWAPEGISGAALTSAMGAVTFLSTRFNEALEDED